MDDVIYLDFHQDLYFSGDLWERFHKDSDKSKPKVCIRTTQDVIYLLPENHPDLSLSPITNEDLDSINLVEIIVYWNGNEN